MPRDSGRSSGRGSDRGGGRERDSDREERGSSKKGGFVYRGRTSEDVTRRAKQSSGRYDSFVEGEVTWFKPREGENTIRLLPWLNGDDPEFKALDEKWGNHWGIDIILHSQVGADKGQYLCLDKMNGEPCPVCEVWRGDDEEALAPGNRVLCWLIDRNDERAGPKLWSMPLGVSKDFSAASKIKGSGEVLLVDDPEEGYDIYFDREGEKKLTKYKRIEVSRDPTPLHDKPAKMDAWLDYVAEHRLPDLLKFYEPDYLEKVLSGQVSARERDDGEDDDRGSRRGGRGRDRDDDREERGGGRSRPSRARDAEPEDDPPARSSRRGARDAEAEEEFSRPSRRGRAAEPEPEEDADPEPEARGSRRGRSAPEDAPESRGRSRGRAAEPDEAEEPEPEEAAPRGRVKPGKVERRKPKEDDEDIPFDKDAEEGEVEAARGRLRNVGRRGR